MREKATKEGIDIFYILAKGKLETLVANETVMKLEDKNLLRITRRYTDEVECQGKSMDVVCIRLEKPTNTN